MKMKAPAQPAVQEDPELAAQREAAAQEKIRAAQERTGQRTMQLMRIYGQRRSLSGGSSILTMGGS